MKLTEQKCEACRADTPPLSPDAVRDMMPEIPEWTLKDSGIERTFHFKDFKEAMQFVNQVADAANQEDHHPDIHIYYNKVHIVLFTHKIKGLSQNDFILAAKIDAIPGGDL